MRGDMFESPLIELRVREMGQQFAGMIDTYHAEVEEEMRAGIKKAISELDFELYVVEQTRREVKAAVDRAIKNYFTNGEGGRMIDQTVNRILKEAAK